MKKSMTYSCRGKNSFSVLFFFLILVLTFTAGPAQALEFTVDSTTDAADNNPGNGECLTDANECTLRAAIQEANALALADVIMVSEGTYVLSAGDLEITDELTITGDDAGSTIDGDALDGVITITTGTTVSISKVTITNGNAAVGGGIYNDGTLTLSDVTISSNTVADVTFGDGGGIYNDTNGSLTLANSTISGNTANNNGGGIYNNGTMTLTNVTISGNTATAGNGGGINNANSVNIINATIAENDATAGAGGGIYTGGTTTLKNTILDNNTSALDGNCAGGGTLTSNGYNISSDNNCNFLNTGDWNETGAVLGALQDNGGPTYTHALGNGSPAIDSGDMVGAPATDQRGVARPQDGDGNGSVVCDIGAYESAPVTVLTPNGGEIITAGESYAITWIASPDSARFEINFSKKPGQWKRIAKNLTGSSFSWLVPLKKNYNGCLIKIKAYNSAGQKIGEDISDGTFDIKIVNITSPVGGESVAPGESVLIKWEISTPKNPIYDTRLYYSTDCGNSWEVIDTIPGNIRTYNWTVPALPLPLGDYCSMVKVQPRNKSGNSGAFDISPDFVISVEP